MRMKYIDQIENQNQSYRRHSEAQLLHQNVLLKMPNSNQFQQITQLNFIGSPSVLISFLPLHLFISPLSLSALI